MNKPLTIKLYFSNRKAAAGLIVCVLALVVLALTQDFLQAHLKNAGYYFSESFMFSSFWWLFAPLLYAQYFVVTHTHAKRLAVQLPVIILPVIVHLFAFPLLVWILSSTFYYHTFALLQTVTYTLSEHLYQLVFFYAVPVFVYRFFYSAAKTEDTSSVTLQGNTNHFIDTIPVSEGNKKHRIAVARVLYFSANPPYINVHLEEKRYLQNGTLKSISAKLNPEQFIRIHKSVIINIEMAASYTSRLNGDYDVTMKNKVTLRVSRNFAIDFKRRFGESHRLTPK